MTLKPSLDPHDPLPIVDTRPPRTASSLQVLPTSQIDASLRSKLSTNETRLTSEELLNYERRLYETALSNTPDLVYIFDLSHRFIYANRSLLGMWNRSLEDAIGKNCLELGYEPWHAEMHDREIEAVIRTKAPIRGEVPFDGAYGKRIYDYIFSPVLGADGEVIAIAGTTRDVTERKEAEAARRKSEERWRVALEASEFVGTWNWDISNNLVVADERFARLCSVDPDHAAQGVPIEEFLKTIHPDDIQRLRPKIEKIINAGGRFEDEYRLVASDDRIRWVVARGYADRKGDAKPVRFAGVVIDITERKQAEEKLKQSQTELQLLTDALPQQIWTARPDGQLDYVNAFATRYIGDIARTEDILDWLSVVHPDDLENSLDRWQKSIVTGQPYETQQRIKHKASGLYRWNLTRAIPIRNDEGVITKWYGTNTDIEEQKTAEEIARKKDFSLRTALNAGRMGTWELDVASSFLTCSEICHANYGLVADEELTFQKITEMVHAEDRDYWLKAIAMSVQTAGDLDIEYRIVWPDQSVHWIYVRGSATTNAEGQTIALSGVSIDVTERKLLETTASEARRRAEASDQAQRTINQALLAAQEQTEQQKRMYETVLDNTADFNYVFDLEGHFSYTNKALADLLQKSPDEFVGKNFFDLGYPSELAERLQRQIQQVITTRQSVRDETPYTSVIGTRAYEYIFRPVIGAEGKVEAVAGSTRDITELKEANRRKDEFLAMLAHELRNPLAPISNSIHLMKSSTISDKIREEAAMLVDRQIVQMTHLLNDLLDVSRVTLGKIELRLQRISLSDVIDMAVETVRPLIESREQTLDIAISDPNIGLHADETRIVQIFSNLLNNAAKYTQKSGSIQIDAYADACGVTVKISDNGIGIPKEMQAQIFDLFSQVDSSMERAQGGLGIGLTLVKSLVEMHKGTVIVESEGKGKGSVFTVRFPPQILQQNNPSEIQKEVHDQVANKARRVLIVDDNEASAKTLGWMLEMMGHDIRLAHDGAKAIEIAETYRPHIILLDIGLPGMSGYEICEILRKRPLFKDCTFIAQTGWGQKEHMERSKAAGFDYHLVKPIRMEKLQEIFQEIASEM